jgi:hypothetical protein
LPYASMLAHGINNGLAVLLFLVITGGSGAWGRDELAGRFRLVEEELRGDGPMMGLASSEAPSDTG